MTAEFWGRATARHGRCGHGLLIFPRPIPGAACSPRPRLASRSRRNSDMVVAADPPASETALRILRSGGNAVDAAIAAQMVLTLVEPQSSGIGGGGFLLHCDGKSRDLDSLDGRETAPALAHSESVPARGRRAAAFYDAVVGGLSVGVPGLCACWSSCTGARAGCPGRGCSSRDPPRRAGFRRCRRGWRSRLPVTRYLKQSGAARAYFYDARRQPLRAGSILRNPA